MGYCRPADAGNKLHVGLKSLKAAWSKAPQRFVDISCNHGAFCITWRESDDLMTYTSSVAVDAPSSCFCHCQETCRAVCPLSRHRGGLPPTVPWCNGPCGICASCVFSVAVNIAEGGSSSASAECGTNESCLQKWLAVFNVSPSLAKPCLLTVNMISMVPKACLYVCNQFLPYCLTCPTTHGSVWSVTNVGVTC